MVGGIDCYVDYFCVSCFSHYTPGYLSMQENNSLPRAVATEKAVSS